MNRLSTEKRAFILKLLVEGNSMRSASRIADVSLITVANLLKLAGKACCRYHNTHVRGLKGKRKIQCDELWSFVYAKDKARDYAQPWDASGSVWTFTALDKRSRLIVSYEISAARDTKSATILMQDLASRLKKSPKISSDKLKAYEKATKKVFQNDANIKQSK